MAYRRATVDHEVPAQGRAKTERVDLGLAILSWRSARRPRRPHTNFEIAAYCGCTDAAIFKIEKRALRKLRNAVYRSGISGELAGAVAALGERNGVSERGSV